jgi:hypothetical protein
MSWASCLCIIACGKWEIKFIALILKLSSNLFLVQVVLPARHLSPRESSIATKSNDKLLSFTNYWHTTWQDFYLHQSRDAPLSSLVVLIIPPLLRLLITLQNYPCTTRYHCHSVSHTLRINITRKFGPLSTPLARCWGTLQAKGRHHFSTRRCCSSAEITAHA